ncbi:MAG: hypothetical protein Q9166_002337 [cf. Caloplaca sp. 2 TL-2023]
MNNDSTLSAYDSFGQVIEKRYKYGLLSLIHQGVSFFLSQKLPVPTVPLILPSTVMSRHNRRRTRASYRNAVALSQSAAFEHPDLGSAITRFETRQIAPINQTRGGTKRNELPARHWHNRYMAWQSRERRQREEQEKLLTDQRRIFGGENGEEDEEGLCSNMLEYFAGLDFIMEPDGREHC